MGLSDLFSRKKDARNLEEQLAALARCGIRTKPEFDAAWIAKNLGVEADKVVKYELLLSVMGGTREAPPWDSVSDNIWHFHTECIEDHGSYVRILKQLADLAAGTLDFRELKDFVDIDEETAWVEFVLDREKFHWDLKVKNDWMDAAVFSKTVQLMDAKKTGRKFTYVDLHGQDCLVGCSTDEERRMLRRETGLEVRWLT